MEWELTVNRRDGRDSFEVLYGTRQHARATMRDLIEVVNGGDTFWLEGPDFAHLVRPEDFDGCVIEKLPV